jgi:anaerobic ribonucleoside-triphosphate reductase activating protein
VMTEITLAIFDKTTGNLVVNADDPAISRRFTESFGNAESFGCAKPATFDAMDGLHYSGPADDIIPRISGIWHNSFAEGPGRRSVVRFQGCPIRCAGCWVPETHDPTAGFLVEPYVLAAALTDPWFKRDGVTILGGEPFAQPKALAELVTALQYVQPLLHITVYTGYTLEALDRMSGHMNFYSDDIASVLTSIDVLIEGPYVSRRRHTPSCSCSDSLKLYSGSCNQRIFNLR